ncbi:MAG: type II toxin-antitoxin system RelE/ParE family toxin [Chloroflexi bacterium]|nr:type II toxin-antitoxin system RelE/ParE family toxin [Chloroflexota bacterium]
MYAVEFLRSAARVLSKLDPRVRRRIARRIDRLMEDPRGDAVKLRGADDVWRARAGDYRILYQVEDDRLLILVIRIGHRRDVYR